MRVGRSLERTRARLIVAIGTVLAVAGLAPGTPTPPGLAQSKTTSAKVCGKVVALKTHDGTTTRYALAGPKEAPAGDRIALVLLVGGGGDLEPRRPGLSARAVRQLAGALPPALSRRGLRHRAGRRAVGSPGRGRAGRIQDVVGVVGTSRGTISAANVALRFTSLATPDGVVLTSAVTSGSRSGRKAWVSQTVFDLKLHAIRRRCSLSATPRISARGSRQRVVLVKVGPGLPAGAQAGLDGCEGRTPHGFVQQEAEVAAGIARFVRGGSY
jgi:hypothetical protein